ncbi:alpha/beta fold hydrolase [Streptococcus sp. zg-86]|uniref:Alpha/beta fold hydrolase n=1 Tax=Streptococcus zhangguiae TaxID=2664091 RepID=A0A6I4RFA1_9STRE|nr:MULTISPECIES: alpha/beta fold hydrolase [unclassified Streptococcus]MTB64166.1 alpha/beta fold hydrolase [Streptococcus sp. zg-86]MTB90508.1 alpha/beta fold hydrolase [Streptococcus sp. zg-36]MWV56154.1 alpha/beta fold hydrolase [Streptococcus sp. zg-70]QTH48224.1 alpha/beta fold hydrolase [Streptococcus sp. zg-86]
MKWWKIIGLGGVFMLVLAYVGTSFYFAKSIVKPTPMTLAEEEAWEKEHGLWNDFDQYEVEEYTVKGVDDYPLHVTLVKAADPNSKKYVIITHGFRSNRNGAAKYVEVYRSLGYHCIIYDVRGHGKNAPATVTLGNVESKDLLYLIEDSYQRYGSDSYLGLQGESMGSSISLNALQYQPKVQFVVADCGFTNLYDLIAAGYQANHVSFLMPGVSWMTKHIYGVDMKETSAIDAVANNQSIPITFIHGADDRFILPENSQQLAEKNPTPDTVKLVDGAAHAASREILGVAGYQALVQQNPNVK